MKIVDIRGYEILTTQGSSSVRVELIVEHNGEPYSHVGSAAHGTSRSTHEAAYECTVTPQEETKKFPHFTQYQARINQAIFDIKRAVISKEVTVEEFDRLLCEVDGTKNKQRLGSSVILATSIAAYRAESMIQGIYLGELLSRKISDEGRFTLPLPLVNIINGGVHTSLATLAFQELLLVPTTHEQKGKNFPALIFDTQRLFFEIQKLLKKKMIFYGYGAEGGIAAQWSSAEQAFDTVLEAITNCGLSEDFVLGVDCAASTWYDKNTRKYKFSQFSKQYTADQLIEWYEKLLSEYPIAYIEDPFAEDDFEHWNHFRALSSSQLIVGDDITATHTDLIERDDITKMMHAVIVKPDQVGTVTETIEFIKTAHKKELDIVISRRSAETEDDFIVDLAVASAAAFCKFGNITQGSISKYNTLLQYLGKIMHEFHQEGMQ